MMLLLLPALCWAFVVDCTTTLALCVGCFLNPVFFFHVCFLLPSLAVCSPFRCSILLTSGGFNEAPIDADELFGTEPDERDRAEEEEKAMQAEVAEGEGNSSVCFVLVIGTKNISAKLLQHHRPTKMRIAPPFVIVRTCRRFHVLCATYLFCTDEGSSQMHTDVLRISKFEVVKW